MHEWNQKTRHRHAEGFAVVVMIVMLGIVMALSVALLNYVSITRKASKQYEQSVVALQMAEAGVQKAIFCLNAINDSNCGATFGPDYIGEDGIAFQGGIMDIVVTTISEHERDVAVVATDATGREATVITRLVEYYPSDNLTQFPYAITSSNKTKLKDKAQISNGPIYTNSDIDCKKGVVINNDVYSSLSDGIIDDCIVMGDAHADRIRKSEVSGGCYYGSELKDSNCGDEYPSEQQPAVTSMPEFDLDFWRAEALKGGLIIDKVEIKEDSELGPVKIEGDLKIDKEVTLTLNGPVWVTKKIEIKDDAVIQINPIYGDLSMVILGDGEPKGGEEIGWGEEWPTEEDNWFEGSGRSGKSGCKSSGSSGGRIKIADDVAVHGTGEQGSYVIFVSTSTKSPAIEAKKRTSGAIYMAPNSSVKLKDESAAVAVAAKCVEVGKKGVIGYDEFGLPAQIRIATYNNGNPRWKIDPGSWREL